MKVCRNCQTLLSKLGLCRAHLERATYCSRACSANAQRVPVSETLLNNTVRNPKTGCWEWTAYIDKKGYGRMGRTFGEVLAHRVSWRFVHGVIPSGLHVCHKCDNPRCINPDHLFLGTNDDNNADKISKGRQRGAAGETNFRAKLTDRDVVAIRSDPRSQSRIAETYGVTQPTISRIKRGDGWTHVTEST